MIPQSNNTIFCHIILFNFKQGIAEENFIAAAKNLTIIPAVQKLEYFKQLNTTNKFEYGMSIEFATQQLYEQYMAHPVHVAFVQQHWIPEVEDSMMIDFEVSGTPMPLTS